MQQKKIVKVNDHVNQMYKYFKEQGVTDEEEVADLVADTVERIAASIPSYDDTKSAPSTWIQWQMWSVLSNHYKKQSRSQDAMDHGTIPLEFLNNRPSAITDANAELVRTISQSRLLSNHQRLIMLLKWAEGYKLYEIAKRLGTTYDATRQAHVRAINLLKEEYGEQTERTLD